ncbi:uncharacterized protein IAS62_000937 [Cryptococcus decagattii]|uniref:GDP/GTP exchange factor Sec2 N-terminal domain-containing protein n=1 Tax=Cryptococcus decagattii TaxID=1859122 RepID=A0ABZ2AMR5_9TREE
MSDSSVTLDPASVPLPPSAEPQASASATLPDHLSIEITGGEGSQTTNELDKGEENWPSAARDLVESLRKQLADSHELVSQQTTKLSSLADLAVEYSQLKDKHAFLSAAKEAVENQLKDEIKKREMAEEQVEMLRGQVEQARRGVMTLQKQEAERKRLSVMSGMGLGFGPNLDEEETLVGEMSKRDSKVSRRTSIMGRSHRRVSSQSEPADFSTAPERQSLVSPKPPAAPRLSNGLRELKLAATPATTYSASPSPPSQPTLLSQSSYFEEFAPQAALASANREKAAAVEEAAQLRSELRHVQLKLAESEESRAATEVCLKALREFLASNEDNVNGQNAAETLKGLSLPPLPTDRDPDGQFSQKETKPAGWGFKLWSNRAQPQSQSAFEALSPGRSRATSSATTNNPSISPLATPGDENVSAGLGGFVSSWTKGVTPGAPQAGGGAGTQSGGSGANGALGASQSQALPRKLSGMGGFFRRATSQAPQATEKELPLPPTPTNVATPSPVDEQGGEVNLSSPVLEPEAEKAEDKRKSSATTLSDLEAELGTRHESMEEKTEGEVEGLKDKVGELEKLDEVEI